MSGLQIGGVANINTKNVNGLQVAGVANITAKTVNGVQVAGVVNYTKRLKGVQIGLINISDTSEGYSIGLINIVLKGYHKLTFYSNEIFALNSAFKTGTVNYTVFFLRAITLHQMKMAGLLDMD